MTTARNGGGIEPVHNGTNTMENGWYFMLCWLPFLHLPICFILILFSRVFFFHCISHPAAMQLRRNGIFSCVYERFYVPFMSCGEHTIYSLLIAYLLCVCFFLRNRIFWRKNYKYFHKVHLHVRDLSLQHNARTLVSPSFVLTWPWSRCNHNDGGGWYAV